MATNLSIDPKLIERALEVSGEKTKKAAVNKALEEFIARRRQKRLEVVGQLEWDHSFDYKAERSRSWRCSLHERVVAGAAARCTERGCRGRGRPSRFA